MKHPLPSPHQSTTLNPAQSSPAFSQSTLTVQGKKSTEVVLYYCIQLGSNFREIPVQIKGFHADLIAAHLVAVIRLDGFICGRIKKHPGNLVRPIAKLSILVFDIGKDLVQIAGMKCVDPVPRLRGVGVILGVYNKYLIASCEHDITLHYRQHPTKTIIQSPGNL